MRRKRLIALCTILIVAETALILNMFYPAVSAGSGKSQKKNVPSRGSVKSINTGIYSDQACTTPVASIDWGLLEPGGIATRTVYMRNEGNSNATLVMTLSNWSPGNASTYIDLNWDYTGQALSINQIMQVRFTLYVQENVQGFTDFSFDLTITTS